MIPHEARSTAQEGKKKNTKKKNKKNEACRDLKSFEIGESPERQNYPKPAPHNKANLLEKTNIPLSLSLLKKHEKLLWDISNMLKGFWEQLCSNWQKAKNGGEKEEKGKARQKEVPKQEQGKAKQKEVPKKGKAKQEEVPKRKGKAKQKEVTELVMTKKTVYSRTYHHVHPKTGDKEKAREVGRAAVQKWLLEVEGCT